MHIVLLVLLLVLFGTEPAGSDAVVPVPVTRYRTRTVERYRDIATVAAGVKVASHYGEEDGVNWGPLKDGSAFRPNQDFVAAHRTLPIGTRLVLTNLDNPRRSIVVSVLDRGPYIPGRDLDLSESAARALGIYEQGVAKVAVRLLR